MAQDGFEVASYRYYFWSSRKTQKANLILTGSGKTCSVEFQEDETTDLPPASRANPTYMRLWFYGSQFDQLLDMLRNEKPVYVSFNDDNGFSNSSITTASEPAGEGELH